ncbi:TPM domain-containing protein [Prochlorococcus sp. MIT 1223]|uniref:TPM domain-containing protein n=1 Tax=Prochlorococcus sp. MIT 1223 TaxID=3096217 RepID=UPI002A759666|nr:TPM domain-containing protein [Prochlorococcus sp. MIT 1223]
MKSQRTIKAFSAIFAFLISLSLWLPAYASNNPELLPDHQTPVIDLARTLSNTQREALEKSLIDYESNTGWKIRFLSQYEKTPGLAVREFWGLDESSLLVIADPRGGNLLNFNVGDAYFALMPRIFWVELQTRYGNQFYVKDHGEDGSVLDAISAVKTCLDKGGCEVVPGLPKEQWTWTLITSLLGGLIAGFAAAPRKEDQLIAWGWLLLLSPLWIILFGVFGVAPVITRTSEILPLLRNGVGFLGAGVIGYLLAQRTLTKSIKSNSD